LLHQFLPFFESGLAPVGTLDAADLVRQGQLSRLPIMVGFVANKVPKCRSKAVHTDAKIDFLGSS